LNSATFSGIFSKTASIHCSISLALDTCKRFNAVAIVSGDAQITGSFSQAEAQDLAAKLAEVSVSIATKAGENGKIYGSINTIQLAEALKAAGHDIDRKSLKIKDEPIREVGSYEAEANIYKGVKQIIKFSVVAE
jgi:ribosomal protein L9